jgi:hypothetical protein
MRNGEYKKLEELVGEVSLCRSIKKTFMTTDIEVYTILAKDGNPSTELSQSSLKKIE